MTTLKKESAAGFTLIEVMIALAIVAIIVAIAYPSYTSQVQQTRRAAAQTEILEVAQSLERCNTRTNSYNGCGIGNQPSEDGRYTITVNADAATYTVAAVPIPGESQDDDYCETMTVNHLGERTSADNDRCWR